MLLPTYKAVGLVSLLAIACSRSAESQQAGSERSRRREAPRTSRCDESGALAPSRVGPLRVGMSLDSVRKVCVVTSDIAVAEYRARLLRVPAGPDTIQVWSYGRVIDWMEVPSPLFRTSDSLGVGVRIGQLLRLPDLTGGVGDGDDAYVVYARSGPVCGLSFWLDATTARAMAGATDVRAGLTPHSASGYVRSVDVRGDCKPAAGVRPPNDALQQASGRW